MKDIWIKLATIDRRIIYLLVFLVVALPMIFRMIMPIRVSNEVKMAFSEIDNLKPGSIVMISIDYDAASEP